MEEEMKNGDEKKAKEKKGVKKREGGMEGKEDKASDRKKGTEKKPEDGSGKEAGRSEDAPPAQPPVIVLRVCMHCKGCARKVKKSLKGFNGVEDVITDCKNHEVVVKGGKADPLKVLERVRRKSHRNVELLSPIPKPPAFEKAKKPGEKAEPKAITVVLKVHLHCEACAQEIKKRIERMEEVEVASLDLKNSQVTVKGTFDPPELVDFVLKRTGQYAVVLKQDPPPPSEAEEKKGGTGGGGDGKWERRCGEKGRSGIGGGGRRGI
ncbi:hypothetical protein Nepgr_018563 [Nepenthes gracilis]|uniref:HMA domain-containing protein n=1 Tax=Nepenthes gracilis TaxID=150966 RepID=A0AAD3XT69_NEPGR|nr:hypothetical protein Nepgr_018563 [Nepenthes gracilis]